MINWILNKIDDLLSSVFNDLPDIEDICTQLDICESPGAFEDFCANCTPDEFHDEIYRRGK